MNPYVIGGVIFLTALTTWQVNEWRHDAHIKNAIQKAQERYKEKVTEANKHASDLEVKLAEATEQAQAKQKEVIRYVETQADDPVCLESVALELFNRGRE